MNTEISPKSEVLIEKALADHTQRNSKPRRGRKPKAESEKALSHTYTFRTDNPGLIQVLKSIDSFMMIADPDTKRFRSGDAIEAAIREYMKLKIANTNNPAITRLAQTILRTLDGGHNE